MPMVQIGLLEEAENCRRQARAYLGQPEAGFLLKVAMAFEELDAAKFDRPSRHRRVSPGWLRRSPEANY